MFEKKVTALGATLPSRVALHTTVALYTMSTPAFNKALTGIHQLIANKSKEDAVATLLWVLKSQALMRWGGLTRENAMKVKEFEFDVAALNTPCGRMLVFMTLNYWSDEQRTKKSHRTLEVGTKWDDLDLSIQKMISERMPE